MIGLPPRGGQFSVPFHLEFLWQDSHQGGDRFEGSSCHAQNAGLRTGVSADYFSLDAMNIRAAQPADAPSLSALAFRSKAYWGYPVHVLEAWRSELTISALTTSGQPTFVAMIGDETAGFYPLSPPDNSWQLDHFWVSPQFMRRGIGGSLLRHALQIAGRAGSVGLIVDADPHAEPFYLKHGAIRRGETAAPIPGEPNRVRPLLVLNAIAI